MSDLVVVSNRGPASFATGPDGALVARHGAGGLAPSLARALEGTGALWIASAMSEGDRRVAASGSPVPLPGGSELRLVDVAPEVRDLAYRDISNGTLWFLHHGLFDRARQPRCDRSWHAAWSAYREYNSLIAEQVAASARHGATVVVNDYHLALLGSQLAAARPDLSTVHFHHTPFCEPEELRVLPSAVAAELLGSLAAFGACGFHTARWADSFRRCVSAVLGAVPETFVAPLGPDVVELRAVAESAEVEGARAELVERLAGRALVLRSDRMELSKNLVRGFLAYEELLDERPGLARDALFVARTYPSREDIPEYAAYRREVEEVVARIAERARAGTRPPVELEVADDFAASVAALCSYDVLLVNPVRDGMNLVAKEGPIVNRRDGVLALSREAGAFAELGPAALDVEPFDVSATAATIGRALTLAAPERERRARELVARASARPPSTWLADVVAAARRPHGAPAGR